MKIRIEYVDGKPVEYVRKDEALATLRAQGARVPDGSMRDHLEAVIDVYRDALLPIEARTYVDGAFDQVIAEASEALSSAPTAPQVGASDTELVDALTELMEWQVKHVKKWHNAAYDNAARVVAKYNRATQPTDTPQSAPSAQGGV